MDFHSFQTQYLKEKVEHFVHHVTKYPKVSVLVQTYNHEKYIEKCLNSILEQKTNFDFEIIIGEDYSSDGTRNICKSFAQKYPEKIRLILHHPRNKIRVLSTLTGNFNSLYNFFSANGEFIAFCEGDDFWTDVNKIQKQVDFLTSNKKYILSYHSFVEVNAMEEPLLEVHQLQQPLIDLSKENLQRIDQHPLFSTVCFRNCLKTSIPEEVAEVINVDTFLLSLLGNYGAAGFINDIQPSFYRRHHGGIWTGRIQELKLKSKMLTFQMLSKYYSRQEDYNLETFFRLKAQRSYKSLQYLHLKNGNLIKFFLYLYSKFLKQP